MGRTACTEPLCLYKCAIYIFIVNKQWVMKGTDFIFTEAAKVKIRTMFLDYSKPKGGGGAE